MPRRKYNMGKRAEAVAATRLAVLQAAGDAYRELGITNASMQEVARRADVAPGTVLYHFPKPDDLAEAVIEWITEGLKLPGPEIFTAGHDMPARVHLLVSEIYDFYARGEAWVDMFFKEREQVPALAEGERRVMSEIGALVAAALEPASPDRQTMAVVFAAIGPGYRGALMQAGLSAEEAIDTAAEQIVLWIEGHSAGPQKGGHR